LSRLYLARGARALRLASLPIAVCLTAITAPALAAGPTLLGNSSIPNVQDNDGAGVAEAFSFTATADGSARTISVYDDAGSSATGLIAGLYSDAGGHPGSLLASGTNSSPNAGQWNDVTVDSTPSISSGRTYWLAVLGTGGQLNFRDAAPGDGGCSETSSQSDLTGLPQSWSTGSTWNTCSIAAYVDGSGTTVTPPPPPPPPPPSPAAPTNTAAPVITGTPATGATLSTSAGSWTGSPTSYDYQWQDCAAAGGGCSEIAGATSKSYTVVTGDVGKTVRVRVTAANAGGSASQVSAPTAIVPAPAPPPPPTPTTNCILQLVACGYPDPSTTGVPAGTSLTDSGSIYAGTAGEVISGENISGSVTIAADNVTITDSRIVQSGASDTAIVHIPAGVTGTKITHTEIAGSYSDSTCTSPAAYDVLNASGDIVLDHDYLHCAAEPMNGLGTVTNSYIIADGDIPGAHYEAIYVPGGSTSPTDIDHNTLLNPHSQTAGIFGDDHAWGPIHNLTINDNLVADGGDNGAIATGQAGDGNTNVTITNNRLSYVYDSSMSAGLSTAATWTDNYRDDTLAPVAATG